MNDKEERDFAELVNRTDGSKVKFYQCDCQETDEGELCKWSFHFDGDYSADKSDGRYSLTSSIHDYLIWSSQRIKELEAKLALAKTLPDTN